MEFEICDKCYQPLEACDCNNDFCGDVSVEKPGYTDFWEGCAYGLMTRGTRIVFIKSSLEDLDDRINDMYWNEKMQQPKGNNYTKEDFMKHYTKVKIQIEPLLGSGESV